MSALIAVTGASGFLGMRLIPILLAKGYRVRAIHRRDKTPESLAALACDSLEIRRANLESPEESLAVLRNADAVIHAAALARDWGPYREFMKANVEITEILVAAARKAKCSQFILISSLSVQGFGRHVNSTEEGPYYPISNPYPISKKKAEAAALANDAEDFSVSILRLGYIYGPGDTTSTYKMFDAASKGVFGWIGNGNNRTSMVYVDDACLAIAKSVGAAAIKGKIVNIVGDESISWKDFARLVYKALDLPKNPVQLPKSLAFIAAAVLSAIFFLTGNRAGPPLTFYRVRRSTVEYVFSNEKSKRLLGFRPATGIEEGLRIAATTYRSMRALSGGS